MDSRQRRRFLRVAAAACTLGISGCSTLGPGDSDAGTTTTQRERGDGGDGSDGTPGTEPATATATDAPTTASATSSADGKFAADDGDPGDHFGASIALDGDTAVVGAAEDEDPNGSEAGSAYVFERADGSWRQTAKLLPEDGEPGDWFGGGAVALAGDTALVSAHGDANSNGTGVGAVYAFERTDGSWEQRDKLVPDEGERGDRFGWTVALADETVLVGASGKRGPNGDEAGAAYVFERVDASWTQQAKLTPDDRDAGDKFGSAVALTDTLALVGAGEKGDPNGPESGAVYAFERSGGSWTQDAKLTPSDGESGDWFGGGEIVVQGDTALVSAHGDANPNGDDAGAAYLFTRDGNDWSQEAKLLPADGDSGDHFGRAVALEDGTAVLGAPDDDGPNGGQAGSAYVLEREGDGWSEGRKLAPADRGPDDVFGWKVALSGDTALVAADADDDPNGSEAGAVYAFDV